jgi:hypothetical protein
MVDEILHSEGGKETIRENIRAIIEPHDDKHLPQEEKDAFIRDRAREACWQIERFNAAVGRLNRMVNSG